jgi:glyoxylase-like metal-dependent hydrolase (beta-lactamase superfamily II)
MTLSGTNTYLVGRPAWVIDPGPEDARHLDRVVQAAEARGGVAGIALTHNHLDHSGAAQTLRERSGGQLAGAAQVASVSDDVFREPQVEDLDLDVELKEGDSFGPLAVLETPGHAHDHLTFVLGEVGFVGDTVLGEGSVFIPPEARALQSYFDSLRKLQSLKLSTLCPGHGPIIRDPQAKLAEYVEHRLDRERRLIGALEQGLRSEEELLDAAWSDVPPELRGAAALTLRAHMEKLAAEGRLPPDVRGSLAG